MVIFNIIVVAAIVLAFMTIGILSQEIAEERKEMDILRTQIETLRLKLDAHDTIIAQEMARNETLEQQLIEIQNRYVKVKRDNENLAHRLARGEINGN